MLLDAGSASRGNSLTSFEICNSRNCYSAVSAKCAQWKKGDKSGEKLQLCKGKSRGAGSGLAARVPRGTNAPDRTEAWN
jgi:hypothetical protein